MSASVPPSGTVAQGLVDLAAPAADHHRQALELRVAQQFDRCVEGVHVEVGDAANRCGRHGACRSVRPGADGSRSRFGRTWRRRGAPVPSSGRMQTIAFMLWRRLGTAGPRCLPARSQRRQLADRRRRGVPPRGRAHRATALPRALRPRLAHAMGHGARLARRRGDRPVDRARRARRLEAQRRAGARTGPLRRPRSRLHAGDQSAAAAPAAPRARRGVRSAGGLARPRQRRPEPNSQQRYERRGEADYWYAAPRFDYAGMLEVTADGFVRRYPTLWEAEA